MPHLKSHSHTQPCLNIPLCVHEPSAARASDFFFSQRHHDVEFVKFPEALNLAAGLIGAELE